MPSVGLRVYEHNRTWAAFRSFYIVVHISQHNKQADAQEHWYYIEGKKVNHL